MLRNSSTFYFKTHVKNIDGLTFDLSLILLLNMYKKLMIQFFSIFTEQIVFYQHL